jgi:hypothetical protein
LLDFLFNPEDGGTTLLQNISRLYGITSQKIMFFIVTALRTVNPKQFLMNPPLIYRFVTIVY